MLNQLPEHVRRQAREAYRRFEGNPNYPGLNFKHVGGGLYSARIGRNYRAVGTFDGDDIVWFWVGDHEAYDRLLKMK
jgi:hypothetical protein